MRIFAIFLLLFCHFSLIQSAEGQVADPNAMKKGSIVIDLYGNLPLIAQGNIFAPFDRELTRHDANELLRKAFRAKEQTIVLDLTSGFTLRGGSGRAREHHTPQQTAEKRYRFA